MSGAAQHLSEGWRPTLGALPRPDGGCDFCVWAPAAEQAAIHLRAPRDQVVPMARDADGTFRVTIADVAPGAQYLIRLGAETERPDPASRYQPGSVHGPSQVVAQDFPWTDAEWAGPPLDQYIFYELHVGAFTPEGTFDAIIPHLGALAALGVTAIELMPVAQFPGARNWGYDGVLPYAAQNSYGGPDGLRRLVDACHARGLAVVLDVVYNHLGPEGNYLRDFGPYFTERYHTPWGDALNFDGPGSDGVRRFFIENALTWTIDYHIDALRLDATHAMLDFSARTFLEELALTVHHETAARNRRVYLIAENDRGDDRLLRPPSLGGYGLDAQWSDELHHVLHTLLTGERFGYYEDFGAFPQIVKALRNGFVYAGEYSSFRQRRHGTFRADLPAERFVVCAQNHDQIGNRMNGDRLSALVSFDQLKLAAGIVLLSPYLPLLFMGEEYGETAPFLYFTGFEDPALGAAVSAGRRAEFEGHAWHGEAPDPQAEATFARSKLNHDLRHEGRHMVLRDYYAELIRLRKTLPALRALDKDRLEVIGYERERVLFVHRWQGDSDVIAVFNFSDAPVTLALPVPRSRWEPILYSAGPRWQPPDDTKDAPELAPLDGDAPAAIALASHALALFARRDSPDAAPDEMRQ